MTSPVQRLQDLGFTLPNAPAPVANYVPFVICGSEIRTSGQIPMQDGALQYKGSVPSAVSVEDAIKAAELCGLNAIAVAASALDGDVNKITRVLQIKVFVHADIGFEGHSTIANGASDLMVAVFGELGRHVRVAVGSIGLPLGATVEVEAVFEHQTS